MVTKTQLDKLTSRIEGLAGAFDPKPIVNVAVFKGETEEFAIQRHRKLRPEHAGMVVRINYRDRERDWAREIFAVYAGATEADGMALRNMLDEGSCGPRNFLPTPEDLEHIDELREEGEDWVSDYQDDLRQAGLNADVPRPAQH